MTQDSFSGQQDVEGTDGAFGEQVENTSPTESYGENSSTEGTYGEEAEGQSQSQGSQDQSYGEQSQGSQDQSYDQGQGDFEGQSEGGRSENSFEPETESGLGTQGTEAGYQSDAESNYGSEESDQSGQSDQTGQSEQAEGEPEGGYSGVAVDLPPLEDEQAEESVEGQLDQ